MSKSIYVQAKADHIATLWKASPVAAIEELVWNALDAGAREVRVDVATNPLGGVESVRVADDGSGIDVLRADATFGSLGGSWKRLPGEAAPVAHRRLHGRHGCGRFKAFALGTHVEWRTTTYVGGELLSYKLTGEADEPGIFTLDSVHDVGVAPGTEVYIDNARATCDALLDAGETVPALAARFALYLKSYPDVRIFFNGLPVTPLIVQREVTEYALSVGSNATAKLEVIEWKRKFTGAGRLVLSGPDGFELHEVPALVRTGGAAYTAYLVAARFPQLNAENALVMDELNPEVRAYLDAAKQKLKEHFAARGAQVASDKVGGWLDEGSYPYAANDAAPERKRFDTLAIELSGRLEGFGEMSASDRGIVFRLLKRAMAAQPTGGLKEFLK